MRIVHLGLGAFHRSHQAWYTARASPDWGIAAFTGRRAAAAEPLREQDGLFTLVERGPETDSAEIIGSLSVANDGRNMTALAEVVSAPETALVTLTITEAGYALDPAALIADRRSVAFADPSAPAPSTALGRLALALESRRRADAGPLAVIPCDNLPGNGSVVKDRLLALAADAPDLAEYIETAVHTVSTSVDRITPAITGNDRAVAKALTGFEDHTPVVAEPFRDWTLAGSFPAGRPAWEDAGARFVDDVTPYERRKLWLLNGAHTILAAAGSLRGHATVSAAMADNTVRVHVERFWDEAAPHLPAELDVPAYRDALAERFLNPRIEHRLSQIARDAEVKVRARILPVLRNERRAGRDAAGCKMALAAWADAVGGETEFLLNALDAEIASLAADVDALRARVRQN